MRSHGWSQVRQVNVPGVGPALSFAPWQSDEAVRWASVAVIVGWTASAMPRWSAGWWQLPVNHTYCRQNGEGGHITWHMPATRKTSVTQITGGKERTGADRSGQGCPSRDLSSYVRVAYAGLSVTFSTLAR
jgi:hypothetical protein